MNLLAPLYRLADRIRFRLHADAGRHGEDLAHRYLRKAGFIITARNWRPPQGGGELDLIAWETPVDSNSILVFVEVKARTTGEWNVPERDIDADKMKALRRAARDYVRRCGVEASDVRFDVISIVGETITHYRDAFPFSVSL